MRHTLVNAIILGDRRPIITAKLHPLLPQEVHMRCGYVEKAWEYLVLSKEKNTINQNDFLKNLKILFIYL